MSGRRSERARKSIDYSKLGNKRHGSDQEDSDDFVESILPTKKRKNKRETRNDKVAKKRDNSPTEGKARNRMSEEDKYNLQLQEALKISLMDSSCMKELSKTSSSTSVKNEQSTITIKAEVLDSPNTRTLKQRNKKDPDFVPVVDSDNGAVVPGDDVIIPAPIENSVSEVKRQQKVRNRKSKTEEDEYQLSAESESEDSSQSEHDTDDSDYGETPRRKSSTKTWKEEKRYPSQENKFPTTSKKPAPVKSKCVSKNKTETPDASPTFPNNANVVGKTLSNLPSPRMMPKTPKNCGMLSRISPSITPGNFVHPGWTPPGPAGSKPNLFDSSPSPRFTRVGLSRNVRLTPLHRRTSWETN